MKVVRAVAGCLGCLVLTGCGDIPNPTLPIAGPASPASFEISEQEAYAISSSYEEQDPLGPLSVDYLEFFNNPELVTDQQFVAYADPTLSDLELAGIEQDAGFVEDYAEACVNESAGPGGEYMTSVDCERMYGRCVSRVRRIPERRARALGYAACMGAYAICRAAEELGEMQ